MDQERGNKFRMRKNEEGNLSPPFLLMSRLLNAHSSAL